MHDSRFEICNVNELFSSFIFQVLPNSMITSDSDEHQHFEKHRSEALSLSYQRPGVDCDVGINASSFQYPGFLCLFVHVEDVTDDNKPRFRPPLQRLGERIWKRRIGGYLHSCDSQSTWSVGDNCGQENERWVTIRSLCRSLQRNLFCGRTILPEKIISCRLSWDVLQQKIRPSNCPKHHECKIQKIRPGST